MQNSIDHLGHDRNIGLKSLNGPEGSVSAAIVYSLHLLDTGLIQMHDIPLENSHSTVNNKDGTETAFTNMLKLLSLPLRNLLSD